MNFGLSIPCPQILAVALKSSDRALIVRQIFFRCDLRTAKDRDNKIRHGFAWCFDTYEEWQTNHFPWLSVSTVRRHFQWLEKEGWIISGQFSNRNRRKWYRVNAEKVDAVLRQEQEEKTESNVQNEQIVSIRPAEEPVELAPCAQNGPMQALNLVESRGQNGRLYTEIETPSKTPYLKPQASLKTDQQNALNELIHGLNKMSGNSFAKALMGIVGKENHERADLDRNENAA